MPDDTTLARGVVDRGEQDHATISGRSTYEARAWTRVARDGAGR
jgi:hypothetical protein